MIVVYDRKEWAHKHLCADWDIDEHGRLWIFPKGLKKDGPGSVTWRHAAAQENVMAIYNADCWARVEMSDGNV